MKITNVGSGYTVDELEPGEPIFVVRGLDALAVPMINQYVQLSHGTLEDDKYDELLDLRDLFVKYARQYEDTSRRQFRLPD